MDNNKLLGKIKDYIEDKLYVGPKGIIGIDIGLSGIKFSEVVKSGDTYKLNRYCVVDLPEGTIIEDEVHKEDEVLKALQLGLKNLKSSNKWVCLGLSGANTVIKRLQLPGGTYEEIEDNVSWEIEQYLPYQIDEANISFSVVSETKGGGVDVIIGSAKKELVNAAKELVEKVGVKVKIVDLSVAAMSNVFELVAAEELAVENSTWILIDIGAQKSIFTIYKNGLIVFTKDINTGGLTITEEIQRQMGVNFQEAESLKIQGDGNGNIPEEIIVIINQVLDSFFSEVKKTIDFWLTSSTGEEFNGCFLTGGSAQIPGLSEALQEVINTEVGILNPFSKLQYNANNIAEEDLAEIAYRGIISIGLGMREVEK